MDWIAHRNALLSDDMIFGKTVRLTTNHPVAIDSEDYIQLYRLGAVRDATDGAAFAAQYMSKYPEARTALDIGCALGVTPLRKT